MRIHRNQFALRVLGTATGAGFLAFGLYVLVGGENLDPYIEGRARGFALTTIIAGVWAIAVSWLDSDLLGVWCRTPKRWR